MHTARLFTNGRSQAVRIPKSLAFEGISEVVIRKDGNRLILEPARKNWKSLAEVGTADDDFLVERPDVMQDDRVRF